MLAEHLANEWMLYALSEACGHRHQKGQASVLSPYKVGGEVAYQRVVAIGTVGWGEGSLHFSGFWDLNCITSKSGTSCTMCVPPRFTLVLSTLCCLLEGFFSGQSPSL